MSSDVAQLPAEALEADVVLTVDQLSVSFTTPQGPVDAVSGVSFRVPRGQTLALVGESGSGKSVIAQAIMGILPENGHIKAGRMLLEPGDGRTLELTALSPRGPAYRALRGGAMGLIFQEPMVAMSPLHSIGRQIEEALVLHRAIPRERRRALVEDMLALVGFRDPGMAYRQYPFELSGGLRQRAMIAMAMICHPALLIADEPTTALDVTVQAQILSLMQTLQRELGMAILLITHDLGVVANMADELVVLYRGRVMESGPLEPLFRHPQHRYLQALFRAVPCIHRPPHERLEPIRQLAVCVDRRRDTVRRERGAPHLVLEGLSKTYRGRAQNFWKRQQCLQKQAVKQFSLSLRVGECLGLVGESGCGKSTLNKLIMGAVRPDQGTVTFYDQGVPIELTRCTDSEWVALRQRMQMVFQDPYSALSPRMNIGSILSEPLEIHQWGDETRRRQRVEELLAMVGLPLHALSRYPHSFSGGQRQRISIARALALEPELLLLDEPVSALDVSVQAQILNLLNTLREELDLTYLFVSHNLAVVHYMADRIAVMCRGQLVELATTRELFRRPLHPYTQSLMASIPTTDLAQPLDLAQVARGLGEPAHWAPPFTLSDHLTSDLVQVGPEHWVRLSWRSDQEAADALASL